MMAVVLQMLLTLLVLQSMVRAQESAQCHTDNSAKFRFSVSSRQNSTGHRLVGVKIMNDVVYGSIAGATNEMTVDVEHGHHWCNNSEVIITTAQAEAPPIRFRRSDYELFSDLGYYKMHTTPLTWEQAKLTCVKEGAHLLVVNSEGEAEVVKRFFARKPSFQGATWNEHVFLGFNDRAVEGQYVTILGQPLSSSGYTKWASGEPTNTAGCTDSDSDCGLMHLSGILYVRPCLCKAVFICEQEL